MKNRPYNADRAEAAARLWGCLATHEGEDSDAQIVIEKHLEDYADTQFRALADLTEHEGKAGFQIVLKYDNYQDGALVLDSDGKIIGECYLVNLSPNGQFVLAIRAALNAANEGAK